MWTARNAKRNDPEQRRYARVIGHKQRAARVALARITVVERIQCAHLWNGKRPQAWLIRQAIVVGERAIAIGQRNRRNACFQQQGRAVWFSDCNCTVREMLKYFLSDLNRMRGRIYDFFCWRANSLPTSTEPHPAIVSSCDAGISVLSVRTHAGRTQSLNWTVPPNWISAMSFDLRLFEYSGCRMILWKLRRATIGDGMGIWNYQLSWRLTVELAKWVNFRWNSRNWEKNSRKWEKTCNTNHNSSINGSIFFRI